MRHIIIELPDKLAEILERTISREEINLFVNQAVLRQLEEFYAQLPAETSPFPKGAKDDSNDHEWVR